MKPLVSILIPAYNSQAWIADTIKSAIAQTWEPKEIIVVDDGSTDQTLEVARRFASKEVFVVAQEHRGAAATRNHAFSLSQGDFIQWLDADDLLSASKIAKQMAYWERFRNSRMLLSSGWGCFFYRTNRAEFNPSSLWCDLSPIEWLLRKVGEQAYMQTATWLVSRELTEAAGPWDTRLWFDDDGEYFCRAILASDCVRFVPEAKVFYRDTPASRLSYIGRSDKKKDALLISMQLHVKYIQSLEDSDRVRTACLAYLKHWLVHVYPERADIVRELEKIAQSLGGQLEPPQLRWKYAWIQPLFGWGPAKQAQFVLPQLKASFNRLWDKAMYDFESRTGAAIRQRANLVTG